MRRLDLADGVFILAVAAGLLVLLGLGAGLTFFSDEWAYIEFRSLGDPGTWFRPHNEHWTTLPILVYRALVETIGIASYMPYLAVLIGLHLVVATLAYALVRRSSGPIAALAVGIVVVFLGSGFENLYWGFQIGFVGSMASGLGALLAFEQRPPTGRRVAIGMSLLLVSLATSGIGLIYLVASGIELMLDPARRRVVPWLAVPAAPYAAWYVLVGRTAVESHAGLFSLGGPADVPPLVLTGFSAATGALLGIGTTLGSVAAICAVVVVVGWAVRRGRVSLTPRTAGCLAAIATLYALIALARAYAGPTVAEYTRYTYISAVLLAVAVAAQIGRPIIDTPTRRRAWFLVGGLVFVLSLSWNVRLLLAGRTLFEERAERTRALVTVALERPLPASTDPDRTLVLVPSPNALTGIVDAHGSPRSDWFVPWAVKPVRPTVLAEARRVVAEGAEIPLPDRTDQVP